MARQGKPWIVGAVALAALVPALANASASGQKRPVKGVVVNAFVGGSIVYDYKDTYKKTNGECGSGDPDQDYSPIADHNKVFLAWETRIKGLKIEPGARPTAGFASPDVIQNSDYTDKGSGWQAPGGAGVCRDQQEEIPWHCHGDISAEHGSAAIIGKGRDNDSEKFLLELGQFKFPRDCGSRNAFAHNPFGSLGEFLNPNLKPVPLTDVNGKGKADATFHISPKQFDALVKGVGKPRGGLRGDLAAPPYAKDCSQRDPGGAWVKDVCSQKLDSVVHVELKPVKLIR